MRFHSHRLALAILLTSAGIATAAPPTVGNRPWPITLAQTDSAKRADPEDLPTRPRSGQGENPLRDANGPAERGPGKPADKVPPNETSPGANDKPAAPGPSDGSKASEKKDDGGATSKGKGCGKPDCATCSCQVPTCKPKWEDKKTKKATFTMKCDFECVRPWEPYHQGHCCEEKTTPCGEVHTKKKLYKTEAEKVERVLKYEVVMKPAPPCCEPAPACCCLGCRCLGAAFQRVFSWCH